MMQLHSDETETGLFFVGSNFAKVIEIALWGFVSAWYPYFNSFSGKPEEAKAVFSKVLNYYVHGMAFLSLTFFWAARPVAALMVQPPFYSVWTIVGVLSLAQALWGVYVISYAPMVMNKKTGRLAFLEVFCGLVCLALNYFLIPLFDKQGAAIATLLGFLTLTAVSFYWNSFYLQVSYDKAAIFKTALALILAASLSFINISSMPLYFLLMAAVLTAYLLFMWKEGLSSEEKARILPYLPFQKLLLRRT